MVERLGCTAMSEVMNDAQRKLAEDNLKLVYALVSREYPTFRGDEDIIQSGILGLCRAAMRWDESKGVKFSTYACGCIRNGIRQELRMRQTPVEVVSLDQPVGDDLTLEDTVTGENDLGFVDYSFLKGLTEDERLIFDLKTNGYRVEDIQRVTGYSSQKIRKIIRIIRAKYRRTQ